MDSLKEALNDEPGEHIRAKEFLNEAIHWLNHIDFVTSSHDNAGDLGRSVFTLNDVTSNYCALLNWVTLVNRIQKRVPNSEIGNLIHEYFGWPLDVAETFLNCVRNPTMHTGRAYNWGEYDSNWRHSKIEHGDNVDFKGAFDPNISRVGLQPMPWSPNHDQFMNAVYEIGYIQGRVEVPGETPEIETRFFFLGFRKKIEELILSTFTKLKSMTPDESASFDEINLAITLTRMPAPESGG